MVLGTQRLPRSCLLSKEYVWMRGSEGAGPERHSGGGLSYSTNGPEGLGSLTSDIHSVSGTVYAATRSVLWMVFTAAL